MTAWWGAPSLILRQPGARIKTDRRDALGLAELDRAGALTPVWVPGADHEAMRDLVRARAAAARALRRANGRAGGWPQAMRGIAAPRGPGRKPQPGSMGEANLWVIVSEI